MAKKFGYLLITIGFLAGALVSVLDEESVRWSWFSITIVAGAIGILLVRIIQRRTSRAEETLTTNIEAIENSLRQIVDNLKRLNNQKQDINPYDMRHSIDELFAEDLAIFVDGRESIAHAYGLKAYADVMSFFAAGERYLNRVWSASADGYVDEVNTYLDKAQAQFAESLEKVRQFKAGAESPSIAFKDITEQV